MCGVFSKFDGMTVALHHTTPNHPARYLILDMSDCYTGSFPEFIPFCTELFYYSSCKVFKTMAQA